MLTRNQKIIGLVLIIVLVVSALVLLFFPRGESTPSTAEAPSPAATPTDTAAPNSTSDECPELIGSQEQTKDIPDDLGWVPVDSWMATTPFLMPQSEKYGPAIKENGHYRCYAQGDAGSFLAAMKFFSTSDLIGTLGDDRLVRWPSEGIRSGALTLPSEDSLQKAKSGTATFVGLSLKRIGEKTLAWSFAMRRDKPDENISYTGRYDIILEWDGNDWIAVDPQGMLRTPTIVNDLDREGFVRVEEFWNQK